MRKLIRGWSLLVLFTVPALADPSPECTQSFHALRLAKKVGWGGVVGLGHLARANFYPALVGTEVLHHAYKRLRGRSEESTEIYAGNKLWKDRYHLLGHLGMHGLQRTTGITHNQFEQETADFLELTEDDVVVVVDAFPENDPSYSGAGSYLFNARYKNHRSKAKAYLIKPKNTSELITQLWEIAKKGKITRLDYYGHGLPGMLVGENLAETPQSIWHAVLDLETRKGIHADQIMAEKSMVRFNTCFAANGKDEYGVPNSAASILGRILLSRLKNGGILYASKVQVLPNWLEIAALKSKAPEMPGWLRTTGDYLSPANGLITAAGAANIKLSDPNGHMEGVFHWNRVQKIWVPNASEIYNRLDKTLDRDVFTIHPNQEFASLKWTDEDITRFVQDASYRHKKAAYVKEGLSYPEQTENWNRILSDTHTYASDPRTMSVSAPAAVWAELSDHLRNSKHLKLRVSMRDEGKVFGRITNTQIRVPADIRRQALEYADTVDKESRRVLQREVDAWVAEELARRNSHEISPQEFELHKKTLQEEIDGRLRIIEHNGAELRRAVTD